MSLLIFFKAPIAPREIFGQRLRALTVIATARRNGKTETIRAIADNMARPTMQMRSRSENSQSRRRK